MPLQLKQFNLSIKLWTDLVIDESWDISIELLSLNSKGHIELLSVGVIDHGHTASGFGRLLPDVPEAQRVLELASGVEGHWSGDAWVLQAGPDEADLRVGFVGVPLLGDGHGDVQAVGVALVHQAVQVQLFVGVIVRQVTYRGWDVCR